MKIVCDACATRYSIPDEKVRGRAVKMRCRRYSQVIVVRAGSATGEAPAAAPAAGPSTAAPAAGADAPRWHLAPEGAQLGPLTLAEVRDHLAAGDVTGETYAWREGLGDWARLHAVPELAAMLPAAAPPPEAAEEPAEEEPEEEEPNALAPSPLRGAPWSAALAPGPAISDGARSSTERNEDSVLFKLDSLQVLAGRPQSARPGHAPADSAGSGLIDIRALAAQTLAATRPEERAAQPGPGNDLVFTPMVAAPLLLPATTTRVPGWAWATAACLLALVGATTASLRLLLRPAAAAAAPASNDPPRGPQVPSPAGAQPPAGPLSPAGLLAAAGEGGAADPVASPGRDDRRAPGKGRPVPAARRRLVPGPGGAAAPAPGSAAPAPVLAAAPAPPRPATRRTTPEDEALTALLNQASPDATAERRPGDHRAAEADLPEQLQRADILAGMRAVQSQVDACFDRYQLGGTALASVVLTGAGKAQSVRVGGSLAGTPSAECVEKALRSASFRRFRGASMSIQFPFLLRQR